MSSLLAMPHPSTSPLHLRSGATLSTVVHHGGASGSSVVAGALISFTKFASRTRVVSCASASARVAVADGNEEESTSDMVRLGLELREASDANGVFQARSRGSEAEGRCSRRLVLHLPLVLGAGIVDAAVAEEAASSSPAITRKVFMDVAIEGQPIGQIVIGLYGDAVPVGAQRFAELAAGKRGIGYRRKEFYKIAKNYVQNVGVRGFSLTGGTEDAAKFTGGDTADALVDEMVQLEEQQRRPKHARGSVSLVALDPTRPPPKSKLVAKDGTFVVIEEQARPAPNGTEFMIAITDAPELDQTNTVVGQVIQGMDVLDRIHSVKVVNENTSSPYFQVAKLIGDSRAVVAEKGFNRPYEKVLIAKCGEIR
ncbi:hypothetical protein M758_8G181600 [Ceratodon purpureus]|nr:hypothetical protein M758_8G181600 [Ceratodon purpureus]